MKLARPTLEDARRASSAARSSRSPAAWTPRVVAAIAAPRAGRPRARRHRGLARRGRGRARRRAARRRRTSASPTRPSPPTSSPAPATAPTAATAATSARPSSTTCWPSWRAPAATPRCSPARTPTTPATGAPACAPRPSTACATRCSRHGVTKAAGARARRASCGCPARASRRRPCLASRIPYGTAVDPATLRADRPRRAGRARARLPASCASATTASSAASRSPRDDLDGALANEHEIARAIKAAGYAPRGGRPRAVPLRPAQRGCQRVPQHRGERVAEALQRRVASGSSPSSRARKPRVGEVRHHRAVDELHQLDRVVLAQPPGRHLAARGTPRRGRRTAACARPSPPPAGRRPRSPRAAR